MKDELKALNEALDKSGQHSTTATIGAAGAGGISGYIGDSGASGSGGSGGASGGSGFLYDGGGAAGQGGHQSPPPKAKFSFNRFIVEPYVSNREVKTANTGRTGFAVIEQKVAVKGLRLLVDIVLDNAPTNVSIDGITFYGPTLVRAGSIVFIREELLHTQQWAKQIMESDHIGRFMIVDKQHIEFVQPL